MPQAVGNATGSDRRALVVEDDADTSALIGFALSSSGFAVTTVDSGLAAVEAVQAEDPDLVTLDLGLPGIDGIEACRRIREISDAYIVMITARDDEVDRLVGLETGADDFMSKPLSARELRARVNALFRRPRRVTPGRSADAPAEEHEVLRHDDLTVDVDARRSYRAGEELPLTRIEFDLLVELMRTPTRVRTRESLLRAVWDIEWASDTHLVEVHVGNLRRKLGEVRGSAGYIRTVRGVGYCMQSG